MTRDTTKTLRPGDEVDVLISEDEATQKQKSVADERRGGGAFTDEGDDDLYAFFKKGIPVYDLGMKLNPDSMEYERVIPDPFVPTDGGFSFGDFDARTYMQGCEAQFLADDPTEETGGKPNRQPIPFEFQKAWTEAITVDEPGTIKSVMMGEDESRPLIIDALTQPSPPNAGNKGWKRKGDSGLLTYKKSVLGYGLHSILFYNPFYTRGGYTFSTGPDRHGPMVPPPPSKSLTGLYLAPQQCVLTIAWTYDDDSHGSPQAATILDSFAVYDLQLAMPDPDGFQVMGGATLSTLHQRAIDIGLYDVAVDQVSGGLGPSHVVPGATKLIAFPAIIAFGLPDNFPFLAAVLTTKEDTFYVWYGNLSDVNEDLAGSPFYFGRGPFTHGIFP